jgi:DNA-binding Xre family transcriptional regulator
MKPKRGQRTNRRSAEQVARDREIRAKFQTTRPTLVELVDSGEFTEPIRHGEYLSLMELASAMKSVRQRLDMSLTQLAEASGIDKAALSRLESGLVENPTISTLDRVAKALGKRLRLALEDSPAGSQVE